MPQSSERWREVLPDLHHLGAGPDAIVERHPARGEWHWRCPALARGGVEAERGKAMRAARAALRELKDECLAAY